MAISEDFLAKQAPTGPDWRRSSAPWRRRVPVKISELGTIPDRRAEVENIGPEYPVRLEWRECQ
jgi:hypothetical protein